MRPQRERLGRAIPVLRTSAPWTAGGVRQDPQLWLSCQIPTNPERRWPLWMYTPGGHSGMLQDRSELVRPKRAGLKGAAEH